MRVRLAALAAAAAVIASLAGASPAAAFPCDVTLTDSTGFKWTLNSFGTAVNGGKGASADPYGGNAIDGFPLFIVTAAGNDPLSDGDTYATGSNSCAVSQSGQEILYPEDPTNVPGVVASRRVYVPSSGRAFGRFVDTVRNTSNAARAVDLLTFGGLGSDCGTKIGDDSSGDEFLGHRDRWMTTFDDVAGNDTCPDVPFNSNPDNSTGLPLAHNFDGPSSPPDRADAFPVYAGFALSGGFPSIEYHDVVLAPGQSASYVHFETQPTTFASNIGGAKIAATGVDGEPAALWTGMSAADLALVRNWCIGDCDKDSVADAGDNCKGVGNPAQLNSDKDALGDACDADDDNDGRSDALEASLGTSPTSPRDASPKVTKFAAPRTAKVGVKVIMTAKASDDYGVRRVTFFARNKRLCVDRAAPFRCTRRFGEKGRRTLTAVATDAIGQVAARTRSIKVNP